MKTTGGMTERPMTRIIGLGFPGLSDSITISSSLGLPELSMLAISNRPPYDSAQTDYSPASEKFDVPLSDYEKLLDNQGILPRLEDQYNW
jgi:hypothetical protein